MNIFKSKRTIWVAAFSLVVSLSAFNLKDNYFEITKNLEIFTNLYRDINIYYVDETKPGTLVKEGIDAMLASLDPYTVYIPESKIEDYRFMTTGQYGGIGATIRMVDEDIYITEPYEGFPANKSGLAAGDKIIALDGLSIEGKSSNEVSEFLRGQSGTELEIEYLPLGGTTSKKTKVKREVIKVKDVPFSGMLNEKTGYIKLSSFTETASSEVKEAFLKLKEEGMKELVFDLRGNGGGLLMEAVNIVNFFIPKGELVVETKGKLKDLDKQYFSLNQPLDEEIPITVLVNGRSASASEIVAGSLQDFDRAIIVGQTSFGKGLVQQTKDLSYNSKLKLTVAKYYIPSGRCIQKLDYTHRNQNGIVDEVPDSLLKSFETLGGRVVMDGRGIEPDIHVEEEEVGRIFAGLYDKAMFFKYSNQFVLKNKEIPSAVDFHLTDAQYNEFVTMAMDAGISYSTESERMLDRLKLIADKEHYLDDATSEFEALRVKLEKNTERDLKKFRHQIQEVLENEIIARYYYQSGRVEATLANDQYIDSALVYLQPEKTKEILSK